MNGITFCFLFTAYLFLAVAIVFLIVRQRDNDIEMAILLGKVRELEGLATTIIVMSLARQSTNLRESIAPDGKRKHHGKSSENCPEQGKN